MGRGRRDHGLLRQLVDDQGPYALRFDGNGAGVERAADLSAFAGATLSFDFRRETFDDLARYLSVLVSDDGGSTWLEIGRIDGIATDTAYQPASFDISAHATAGFRLRFVAISLGGSGPTAYVDNLQIEETAGSGGGPDSVTLPSVADTYVYENQPGAGYGSEPSVTAGKDGNVSLDLYRAGASWDEGTATWTSTSGGGVAGSALAGAGVSVPGPGWAEWSLPPALVHEWIDGITANDGLVLVSTSAKGRSALFASRENATLDNRPQLVIEYTGP